MSSRKLYRQGDVLLVSIAAVPEGAKEKNRVLAKGEFTGHYHAVTSPATVSVMGGTQYVESEAAFTVEHQEHAHIHVPAGAYEVRIQRELDLLGSIRQVMD